MGACASVDVGVPIDNNNNSKNNISNNLNSKKQQQQQQLSRSKLRNDHVSPSSYNYQRNRNSATAADSDDEYDENYSERCNSSYSSSDDEEDNNNNLAKDFSSSSLLHSYHPQYRSSSSSPSLALSLINQNTNNGSSSIGAASTMPWRCGTLKDVSRDNSQQQHQHQMFSTTTTTNSLSSQALYPLQWLHLNTNNNNINNKTVNSKKIFHDNNTCEKKSQTTTKQREKFLASLLERRKPLDKSQLNPKFKKIQQKQQQEKTNELNVTSSTVEEERLIQMLLKSSKTETEEGEKEEKDEDEQIVEAFFCEDTGSLLAVKIVSKKNNNSSSTTNSLPFETKKYAWTINPVVDTEKENNNKKEKEETFVTKPHLVKLENLPLQLQKSISAAIPDSFFSFSSSASSSSSLVEVEVHCNYVRSVTRWWQTGDAASWFQSIETKNEKLLLEKLRQNNGEIIHCRDFFGRTGLHVIVEHQNENDSNDNIGNNNVIEEEQQQDDEEEISASSSAVASSSSSQNTVKKASSSCAAAVAEPTAILRLLIQHGSDIISRDLNGQTCLHRAVEKCGEFLESGIHMLNCCLKESFEIYHNNKANDSTDSNDLRKEKDFIEHVVDARDNEGNTSLLLALQLASNAGKNEHNYFSVTRIRSAYLEAARILLKYGASIQSVSSSSDFSSSLSSCRNLLFELVHDEERLATSSSLSLPLGSFPVPLSFDQFFVNSNCTSSTSSSSNKNRKEKKKQEVETTKSQEEVRENFKRWTSDPLVENLLLLSSSSSSSSSSSISPSMSLSPFGFSLCHQLAYSNSNSNSEKLEQIIFAVNQGLIPEGSVGLMSRCSQTGETPMNVAIRRGSVRCYELLLAEYVTRWNVQRQQQQQQNLVDVWSLLRKEELTSHNDDNNNNKSSSNPFHHALRCKKTANVMIYRLLRDLPALEKLIGSPSSTSTSTSTTNKKNCNEKHLLLLDWLTEQEPSSHSSAIELACARSIRLPDNTIEDLIQKAGGLSAIYRKMSQQQQEQQQQQQQENNSKESNIITRLAQLSILQRRSSLQQFIINNILSSFEENSSSSSSSTFIPLDLNAICRSLETLCSWQSETAENAFCKWIGLIVVLLNNNNNNNKSSSENSKSLLLFLLEKCYCRCVVARTKALGSDAGIQFATRTLTSCSDLFPKILKEWCLSPKPYIDSFSSSSSSTSNSNNNHSDIDREFCQKPIWAVWWNCPPEGAVDILMATFSGSNIINSSSSELNSKLSSSSNENQQVVENNNNNNNNDQQQQQQANNNNNNNDKKDSEKKEEQHSSIPPLHRRKAQSSSPKAVQHFLRLMFSMSNVGLSSCDRISICLSLCWYFLVAGCERPKRFAADLHLIDFCLTVISKELKHLSTQNRNNNNNNNDVDPTNILPVDNKNKNNQQLNSLLPKVLLPIFEGSQWIPSFSTSCERRVSSMLEMIIDEGLQTLNIISHKNTNNKENNNNGKSTETTTTTTTTTIKLLPSTLHPLLPHLVRCFPKIFYRIVLNHVDWTQVSSDIRVALLSVVESSSLSLLAMISEKYQKIQMEKKKQQQQQQQQNSASSSLSSSWSEPFFTLPVILAATAVGWCPSSSSSCNSEKPTTKTTERLFPVPEAIGLVVDCNLLLFSPTKNNNSNNVVADLDSTANIACDIIFVGSDDDKKEKEERRRQYLYSRIATYLRHCVFTCSSLKFQQIISFVGILLDYFISSPCRGNKNNDKKRNLLLSVVLAASDLMSIELSSPFHPFWKSTYSTTSSSSNLASAAAASSSSSSTSSTNFSRTSDQEIIWTILQRFVIKNKIKALRVWNWKISEKNQKRLLLISINVRNYNTNNNNDSNNNSQFNRCNNNNNSKYEMFNYLTRNDDIENNNNSNNNLNSTITISSLKKQNKRSNKLLRYFSDSNNNSNNNSVNVKEEEEEEEKRSLIYIESIASTSFLDATTNRIIQSLSRNVLNNNNKNIAAEFSFTTSKLLSLTTFFSKFATSSLWLNFAKSTLQFAISLKNMNNKNNSEFLKQLEIGKPFWFHPDILSNIIVMLNEEEEEGNFSSSEKKKENLVFFSDVLVFYATCYFSSSCCSCSTFSTLSLRVITMLLEQNIVSFWSSSTSSTTTIAERILFQSQTICSSSLNFWKTILNLPSVVCDGRTRIQQQNNSNTNPIKKLHQLALSFGGRHRIEIAREIESIFFSSDFVMDSVNTNDNVSTATATDYHHCCNVVPIFSETDLSSIQQQHHQQEDNEFKPSAAPILSSSINHQDQVVAFIPKAPPKSLSSAAPRRRSALSLVDQNQK